MTGKRSCDSIGWSDRPIDTKVGQWISKLARVLAGEDAREEARELLRTAYADRAKLKLEPLKTSVENATVMTATIEQVRDDDVIINQPVIGGVARPLVTGETLRVSLKLKSAGRLAGEVEVLGRHKIPSGGGPPLQGYRLSLPEELSDEDRRESRRREMASNLAREVEIYRGGDDEPIRGVVQNLSIGGMQIRTHDSQPQLRPGERVRLVVHLPPPVGGLNRMVTVARLAGNRNPRHRVIGIAFEREIPGLAELLAKGQQK
jgi:c-di-GMP-binding flagellar brake protein YcgR